MTSSISRFGKRGTSMVKNIFIIKNLFIYEIGVKVLELSSVFDSLF